MQEFIRKVWVHILAWGSVLAFIFLAPTLYSHWFVIDGREVDSLKQLPPQTHEFKTYIDYLTPYDKRGTYELIGWGFLTTNDALPVEDYQREIVLISSSDTYIFETEPRNRQDVNAYFMSLGENLVMSGFSSRISIYALAPGNYRILLLFIPKGGHAIQIDTGRCIARTPNYLILNNIGSDACNK